MRIALFSECYFPIVNGVVVAVSTLSKELSRQGHQVCLFAPRFPGHSDDDSNIFRLPSIDFPTDPRYPVGLPYLPNKIRSILREFAPQIIHTHSLFGMGRAAIKASKIYQIPVVFTYHTLLEDYSHYIPLPQPLVKYLARKVSRDFANRTDFVIAPGPAALERLHSYRVQSPVEIIPTGADLSLCENIVPGSIRERFQIPPDALVVAFTGRIAKEKNLELLLKATAHIRPVVPDTHLLLIGSGPWQDQILRLASELKLTDNVHLTGFLPRSEVFQALADSSIFAFPSLTDTQGIAVVEAMACGLPTIASKSGAVAEILQDGKEGLQVESNPDSFGAGMLSLLKNVDLRKRMSAHAKTRAQLFSSENCARRVAALYENLLAVK